MVSAGAPLTFARQETKNRANRALPRRANRGATIGVHAYRQRCECKGEAVFHDELMKDEDEVREWHETYGRLSDAVKVSLHKFLDVLKEVERCAHADGKDIHAVMQLLMYDFAEAIDGVTVLVRSGSAKNCPQLLRTAFEVALALRYILEDDQNYERRSLAYEYYHLLDGLKWAQRCDGDHPVGKQLRKELEGDELADIFDVTPKGIDAKKEVGKHEKKVRSARYAVVRTEIDRIKGEKKKGKPFGESFGNWFSLWGGPKDLRTLSLRLKLLSFYEVLYRPWSNVSHGEAALKRISGRAGDGLILDPIRSPAKLPEHCLHACQLTTGLVLTLVDKLVPQLREELRHWYINDMKPALNFTTSVAIKG